MGEGTLEARRTRSEHVKALGCDSFECGALKIVGCLSGVGEESLARMDI